MSKFSGYILNTVFEFMYDLTALIFSLQKNKSWEQKFREILGTDKLKYESKKTFGAKTTVASYAYFARLVVRDDQCWHLESNLTTTLACLSARKCQENNSNPLFLQLTIMRKIVSDSHLFRYWSLLMFPTTHTGCVLVWKGMATLLKSCKVIINIEHFNLRQWWAIASWIKEL